MPNDDCPKCHLGIKHHHHEDSANRCLYEDASGVERCAYEDAPLPHGLTRCECHGCEQGCICGLDCCDCSLKYPYPVVVREPLNALETYRRAQQTEGLLAEWLAWAEEWGDRDMRQSLIARTKRTLEK